MAPVTKPDAHRWPVSLLQERIMSTLGLLLDWPAMATALVGSYLVGNTAVRSRRWGFSLYLVSNLLWITWGLITGTMALTIMSLAFCYTSGRGWMMTQKAC
jgi:hypothetical protein